MTDFRGIPMRKRVSWLPHAVVLAGCVVQAAHASVARSSAADYGYLGGGAASDNWGPTSNPAVFSTRQAADRQPYSNSVWVQNYVSMGLAKFAVASLSVRDRYYLEVSPWSVFGSPPSYGIVPVSLYEWADDDINFYSSDRSRGTLFSVAPITNPDDVSWYAANAYGGFAGDTYIEITSLVLAARLAGHDYLSFRYEAVPWLSGGQYGGQLLRAPVVVGSNAAIPLQPGIPSPGVLAALALAGMCRNRRRS